MKLLVVDDERLIINAIRRYLRESGCEIIEANDGHDALAKVQAEKPDLVLSDVRMPGMDGASFVKALRSQGNTTPVVLMSGDLGSLAKVVNNLVAEGQVKGLLDKPFDPEALRRLIGES